MNIMTNTYSLVLSYAFIGTMYNLSLVLAAYSPAKETEIRNETVLSDSYDPVSRPSDLTHIKSGLSVLAIDELDLKGQKLTMAGWLTFEWEDSRIVWDKAAKDDIEYIFTKPKHIWKPELIVDNSLQDLDIIADDALLLRLKYDGTVDWEPPLLFLTHCEVDITYYPYDQQRCAVEIVSWSYTIEEVVLDHLFEEVNLEDFEIHGEWEITHTEIEDKNLTEHLPDGTVRIYPQLDFWLLLRRRTQFYNLNVMMPIILTSLMVVLVFLVPVDSGEKVSHVLHVFLALSVLLTIVVESLPPTSITLSVLGLYLGIVMILAAVAILLTVFILILFHKEGRAAGNTFIVTLAVCAAKMIFWKNVILSSLTTTKISPMKISEKMETCDVVSRDFDTESEDSDTDTNHQNKDGGQVDMTECNFDFTWKVIAQILDRFCFYFFFIITIIMNVSFVLTLALGGRSTGHEIHSAKN